MDFASKLAKEFKACLNVLSKRRKLLIYLNSLFFVLLLVSALATTFMSAHALSVNSYFGMTVPSSGLGWPIMFCVIFLTNVAVNSFLCITLGGFLLFPLSAFSLCYRALSWGPWVSSASIGTFLSGLPILILESEAYILACMAGTLVGLSWVKPSWLTGSKETSRRSALKIALNENLRIYLFVVLFVLAAAIVETLTIISQ